MLTCPRCGHHRVTGDTSHSPKRADGTRITVVDYFCTQCKLLESMQKGDAGYAEFYRRWHGLAPIETVTPKPVQDG